MNKKNVIVAAVFLVANSVGLYAQEAVPAAGGEASGTGGSLSYTVGQVAYTANTETEGNVNQGVQQPFEIFSTVGINEVDILLEVSTFPNPTNGLMTIKVDDITSKNLTYQLVDSQGKLIETKEIMNTETQVFMGDLESASYFLSITDNDQLVKTFTIIKK